MKKRLVRNDKENDKEVDRKKLRKREVFKFIYECRKFIYTAMLVFFVSAILGYVFPSWFGNFISKIIKNILEQTRNLNGLELFLFIFYNNLKTSFFGMILGLFFGAIPLFLSFFNGYVLGYVSRISVREQGVVVMTRLLPHGIFELPAVLISFGLGIKLGFLFFDNFCKEEKISVVRKSLEVFLFIVLPLLFTAAIIESIFITIFS